MLFMPNLCLVTHHNYDVREGKLSKKVMNGVQTGRAKRDRVKYHLES